MSKAIWSTQVTGKCILAGEHSVLRGIPAIVVPLKSRHLEISYTPRDSDLRIESADEASDPTRLVLYSVLEKAMSLLQRPMKDLSGTLKVKNTVPFGAGLGASAALCVSASRFLSSQKWLPEEKIIDFARTLEDLFHGESSGVDVTVAHTGQMIRFRRHQGYEELHPKWHPNLFLSFSGQKGVTSECVQIVNRLRERQPSLGEELDQKMRMSVERLEAAIIGDLQTLEEREQELVSAFDLALECFLRWGLTEGPMSAHIEKLRSAGAVALKPTGSGGGGHVISYWSKEPPQDLGFQLIKLEI